MEPNSSLSGMPEKGSSSVTLANASAPSTSCRMPSGVRSLVLAEADRVPRNTRNPSPREPDSCKRLHLAHAHVHAELVALADHSFRIARAGLHGQCHHIGGEGFKV